MRAPLRHPLLLALLLALPALLALAPTASAATCPWAHSDPATIGPSRAAKATVCLVNHERRVRGLRPLRLNWRLGYAARRYAQVMVRHGFFDHVSPGGSTLTLRVRRTGYLRHTRGWRLGENIAWGSLELGTPAAIVRAWMQSAGHRRNILYPGFRDFGLGVAVGAPVDVGGDDAGTYVNAFGTRGW